MAMATAAAVISRPSSMVLLTRQRARWVLSPQTTSSYSSSSFSHSTPSRKLVLYSKPGCCLCDGLKEKLQAAFLLSGPDSLHDVDLQIRDITSNPEWERAYHYEIPVLAKILSDGTEETMPRLSPRLGVELVQKKIAAALRQEKILEPLQ
ncbi:Glutaredoxin-like protein [Quillaja saponaria]|uniref:Glutaredoxin-like protein n=1 Tax=Quillaja saponaria TaxID=32244 RepID=A0AAD7LWF6_QUISA|nr:Glutaredoxin-like protein [Quillaja saponaria]